MIVRKYGVGSVINIRVELTANHNGHFEFSLCPDYKSTTQECLDKNILRLARPQENVEHHGTRYFPKEGNKVYEMKYRLPKKSCEHCVLQWRYIAGKEIDVEVISCLTALIIFQAILVFVLLINRFIGYIFCLKYLIFCRKQLGKLPKRHRSRRLWSSRRIQSLC